MSEEYEVGLSGGKAAKFRSLSALDLIKAVGYCGETASAVAINLVTAVCAVCEYDGEKVYPLRTRNEFMALAGKLRSEDTVLIQMAQQALVFDEVTNDQKKALERIQADSTGG